MDFDADGYANFRSRLGTIRIRKRTWTDYILRKPERGYLGNNEHHLSDTLTNPDVIREHGKPGQCRFYRRVASYRISGVGTVPCFPGRE